MEKSLKELFDKMPKVMSASLEENKGLKAILCLVYKTGYIDCAVAIIKFIEGSFPDELKQFDEKRS